MKFPGKLRSLFHRRKLDAEMAEEMRAHIELQTERNIAAGMDAGEARYAAQRQFGNVASLQERAREERGWVWLEQSARDLRYAVRSLKRTPGFTVTAVLTLALGIGACTLIFSVVRAVLLKPLPFHDPSGLVWIENIGANGNLAESTSRVDVFQAWREDSRSFESLGAYNGFLDQSGLTMTGRGEARRLQGVAISQNFLTVLGLRPFQGRGFRDEECLDGPPSAAVLSHALWQNAFGGDPDAVGQMITLNGRQAAIVGVLPASFDFAAVFGPGREIDLLIPFPLTEASARVGNTLFAIGRLAPGATLTQARTELGAINTRLQQANPDWDKFGAMISTLDGHIRGGVRPVFYLLSGAVLCLLAISCVNLSNLLLARANARRHEFALRVALGASQGRLMRQVLTESLLLAVLGGSAGVVVAILGVEWLARGVAMEFPFLHTATLDLTALLFAIGATGITGLVCGASPAVLLGRRSPNPLLRGMGSSADRISIAVRKTLVIAEISLACILLVGAGQLLRSFMAVLEVELGFQPEHLAAWRTDTTRRFDSRAAKIGYFTGLTERVAAVPGIDSVGLSDALPLGTGRQRDWAAGAKGVVYERGQFPFALTRIVDADYLPTMRTPLWAGRMFDARDSSAGPKVVIINETMAKRLWAGQEPIGQTVLVNGRRGIEHEVIGVVADVPQSLEAIPLPEMYLSLHQTADWESLQLVVRSTREPDSFIPDVRAAIRDFDPFLAGNDVTLLNQLVDRAIAPRRLFTTLLGVFSALALSLVAIGLFGVVSYSVSQRTREIGVRLAMGAQHGDVLRLVVGEGMKATLIGVAIGLSGALALSRLLVGLLYGIAPNAPTTLLVAAAVLITVALIACWLPARRAANVDPMIALRAE